VALVLALAILALWPALYLIDSGLEPSPLGEMMARRFAAVAAIRDLVKGVIDWLVPGALWSWEGLVTFFFQVLTIAFVAYAAFAWRLTSVRMLGLRWILGPLALLQVACLFTPATLTTDIYNYALYGEMPVVYGANPFTHTPAEFPQSTLYYLIPLYWHDAPSVYGPAWVLLSMGVAALFREGALINELLAYRAIANLAHFANALLVFRLAERLRPGSGAAASVAYGWNPVALLEFCANGHNDVVMLTPLLLSLLWITREKAAPGSLMLGLSIAQKYTSVLLAPLVVLLAANGGEDAPKGFLASVLRSPARLRRAVLLTLVALGVVAVGYAPFLTGGWDAFGQVAYWITGPRMQNYWPEPLLMAVTAWITGPVGLDWNTVWFPLVDGFKHLARLGLVALILFEAYRTRTPRDVVAGGVRIWLFFLLAVNTWIMPWYYLWPLALAAPLGWSSVLCRATAATAFVAAVLMYGSQLSFPIVRDWGGAMLVLPLALGALSWAWGRGWLRPPRLEPLPAQQAPG
jgi:hypothetical protein